MTQRPESALEIQSTEGFAENESMKMKDAVTFSAILRHVFNCGTFWNIMCCKPSTLFLGLPLPSLHIYGKLMPIALVVLYSIIHYRPKIVKYKNNKNKRLCGRVSVIYDCGV